MKRLVFPILIIIVLFGFITLMVIDRRNVNEYWNHQSEITVSDSLNLNVTETKYYKVNLSFNKKYYLHYGNIKSSNIDIIDAGRLSLPFKVTKQSMSDTLKLITAQKEYYFLLIE